MFRVATVPSKSSNFVQYAKSQKMRVAINEHMIANLFQRASLISMISVVVLFLICVMCYCSVVSHIIRNKVTTIRSGCIAYYKASK
ncbi:hypothetical protein Y032_0253g280 [Ancylostoma ceylanicum]|uniref:Uncharacterized protein n=1 Tax=Ancylostoma ceylanicum TaxID=53326 RepID=A0A016SBT1_9BILA|nr:hypothetical protein Y032_0253g280 [Ancylostoma ceylanicum]